MTAINSENNITGPVMSDAASPSWPLDMTVLCPLPATQHRRIRLSAAHDRSDT
jgi:hypothetical protein